MNRTEIDNKYKWDLSDIYTSEEAWAEAKDKLVKQLPQIETYKGKLTESATSLAECLNFMSDINKEAVKLYIYANMHSDLDTRDMKYSGMQQELQQIFSDFSAKAAFIDPEILSVEFSVYETFFEQEQALQVYRKRITDLFREKEHTLSEAEERILALSSMASGTASKVFKTFSNAEMPNAEVTLSTGEKVTLTDANYGKYRATSVREDREIIFKEFWENYGNYRATFGEMMNGQIKTQLFYTKARKYNSTLEGALFGNNIPVEVYRSLIENVNKNLPSFHRYLDIKRRLMSLDTLKYIDLYAPAVKGVDLKYSYEEGRELILESLAPLGKEYTAVVEKAFDERWIDVYPTKAKRSGAYSNGANYEGHPYILLNYNGLYNDVSTTAHELGHTMHSYFSNKTQPYPLSNYTIFVAEVASTFNEVLLFEHMMKSLSDEDTKLSLLMQHLDGFKGTLFRQTQFAEFELKMHETAQKGAPLTGESLSEMYMDIVKRYYGHEQGICMVDDYIDMEWAFIPHFYYNFYVYQYSTSFIASNTLAEKVLQKEEGALESYMKFLGSGGSDYPINQLKDAGVDMTSTEAFDKSIAVMNRLMDEIETILEKKGL